MVTLLASITGFLGSLFPEIIKYFIDSKDKKHEIEILKYQIKYKNNLEESKQKEIGLHYDLSEAKSLYSTFKSGINWVDALNGTVRPVLAYSFFAIYCVVKWLQFQLFISNQQYLKEGILLLWSLEDQAIFAGIISFYYGNRAINKLLNKKI
jgi:hypothetical protein